MPRLVVLAFVTLSFLAASCGGDDDVSTRSGEQTDPASAPGQVGGGGDVVAHEGESGDDVSGRDMEDVEDLVSVGGQRYAITDSCVLDRNDTTTTYVLSLAPMATLELTTASVDGSHGLAAMTFTTESRRMRYPEDAAGIVVDEFGAVTGNDELFDDATNEYVAIDLGLDLGSVAACDGRSGPPDAPVPADE